ncbi:MAG: dihydroorotate dehydrogenase electron transfer subunit [Clostridia bacterium]|nr:dihydroorotate dehydrogenase electron transfer subunit [Clostridia bacterium]
MAVISEVRILDASTFLLELSGVTPGAPGQFYMIKPGASTAPFLGRPISIFDAEGDRVRYYIDIVGEGTRMLSRAAVGAHIDVTGPFGNGFPDVDGDVVLIGGAAGAAPLYYYARRLRERMPDRRIDAYIGFSRECPSAEFMAEAMRHVSDSTVLNIGGFITADVNYTLDATYIACGPDPMMADAHRRASERGALLYVSLDKRMACGVGACLGCVCHTGSGPQRACKDGPVFDSREVYHE